MAPTSAIGSDLDRAVLVVGRVHEQLPALAALREAAPGIAIVVTATSREQEVKDAPKQQASAYVRRVYRGEEAVTEAQISGNNLVVESYTTVDIGGSFKLSPGLTFQGGVQNLLDKRLDYATAGYLIDPARIWMGVTARFWACRSGRSSSSPRRREPNWCGVRLHGHQLGPRLREDDEIGIKILPVAKAWGGSASPALAILAPCG